MIDHCFANPVVISFDLVERTEAGAPDQMLRPQQGQPGKPEAPASAALQAIAWRNGWPATAKTSSRLIASAGSLFIRRPSTLSRLKWLDKVPPSPSSPPSLRYSTSS